MNIQRVTFYFTLFVSLSSQSMIGCSDASDQKGGININPRPDHDEMCRISIAPTQHHIRRRHDPCLDELKLDSEVFYELYMEIVYPIRMTPVLLDDSTGYFMHDAYTGYFSFKNITEEGHVPGLPINLNKKNANYSSEHYYKIQELLLAQLREPVPRESIHLLLSEYQLALDSTPINWNTIRTCLDISRARFQLQRLPELLPLHKQVFDQARSYDETFDDFICYTINSSLHAIAMHHSKEALQIVDAALNPDYWEEPDEEMYNILTSNCKNLSYSLRGRIIDHVLPVLATEEEILDTLIKWKEYYPLISNDNIEIPDRIKRFNYAYNNRIDELASGKWEFQYPKKDTRYSNE